MITICIAPRIKSTGGHAVQFSNQFPQSSGLCETPIQRRNPGFMAWVQGSERKVWEHGQTKNEAERKLRQIIEANGEIVEKVLNYTDPV